MSLKPPIAGDIPTTWGSITDHIDNSPINIMDSIPPYADVVRDGSTTTSVAVQIRYDLAETQGRAVYWPSGTSAYMAGNILVGSGVYTFGDPWATTIKMPASLAAASNGLSSGASLAGFHRCVFQNKHSATTGNSNIGFAGLVLDGNVSNGNSVDEYYFGIQLYSVQNVSVQLVKVQNLRGDGVYVNWNATVESTDVHIRNIVLSNVGVDAGVGNPRQGVSIIQCRRFSIRDVTANKVSGTGLGYIVDIEPNVAADVIQGGTVSGIHGYDCVGGVAVQEASGGATTGVFVDDVSMYDGPTNTIHSCVAVTRTTGVRIGSKVFSDVAPSAMTGAKRIWLSDASPPSNLTVDATKTETQTRAATTAVQQDTRVCLITGTGAVSAMGKSWAGHVVTFNGANGVTFTDGSGTIRTSAAYAPADGNSTLTLLCIDGTNWIETGRSVNG